MRRVTDVELNWVRQLLRAERRVDRRRNARRWKGEAVPTLEPRVGLVACPEHLPPRACGSGAPGAVTR